MLHSASKSGFMKISFVIVSHADEVIVVFISLNGFSRNLVQINNSVCSNQRRPFWFDIWNTNLKHFQEPLQFSSEEQFLLNNNVICYVSVEIYHFKDKS